jgi:hypothetical protein
LALGRRCCTALPDFPLAVLLAKLHRLRPAQKPIDRNVKPICDLSQPVNVKGAEARVLKVDSAPTAKPNAGAELIVCDAAKAARDSQPLPEYEEIRFHAYDIAPARTVSQGRTAAPRMQNQDPTREEKRMVHAVGEGIFIVDARRLDRRKKMASKLPVGL